MVTLSNISSTLLPPTITGSIFDQAVESSAVMSLARRVPLSMTAQTAIPVSMDIPAAGWVSEGGAKPVGSAGVSVKTMTGKKVALIVPVSQEVATSNAAGLYTQLRQDLPVAIARAFDHAAIHGLDLRDLPALEAFKPQMIFISAGFDAHREDDLGQLGLVEDDYAWITRQLKAVADRHAQGRIVSCLEGGYALSALARSVVAHVRVLAGV